MGATHFVQQQHLLLCGLGTSIPQSQNCHILRKQTLLFGAIVEKE
ncbi:hypothetical protein ACFPT3_16970 [Ectobacillus antri]|jgi:hypothetical protein